MALALEPYDPPFAPFIWNENDAVWEAETRLWSLIAPSTDFWEDNIELWEAEAQLWELA